MRVLAVGASGLEPSITSSSARRSTLTCFSPKNGRAKILSSSLQVPGTKDRISKRDRKSPISSVDTWDMDIIFFKVNTSAVSTTN